MLVKTSSAAILTKILTISDIVFPKNITFDWLPKQLSVEIFLMFQLPACMYSVTTHN